MDNRPNRLQNENQKKWKERQVLSRYHGTKKAVEYQSNGDTNCNWRTWNVRQKFGKEIGVRIEAISTTVLVRSAEY